MPGRQNYLATQWRLGICGLRSGETQAAVGWGGCRRKNAKPWYFLATNAKQLLGLVSTLLYGVRSTRCVERVNHVVIANLLQSYTYVHVYKYTRSTSIYGVAILLTLRCSLGKGVAISRQKSHASYSYAPYLQRLFCILIAIQHHLRLHPSIVAFK